MLMKCPDCGKNVKRERYEADGTAGIRHVCSCGWSRQTPFSGHLIETVSLKPVSDNRRQRFTQP